MKKEPNLAVRRQQKGRRRNRFPVLILDPKFKDPTVCVREFKRAGGILRQMFVLGSGVDVFSAFVQVKGSRWKVRRWKHPSASFNSICHRRRYGDVSFYGNYSWAEVEWVFLVFEVMQRWSLNGTVRQLWSMSSRWFMNFLSRFCKSKDDFVKTISL